MAKAYIFRHQHGGADPSRVFLSKPTDAQMKALNDHADQVFGAGWSMAVETEIVEGDAVPEFDAPTVDGGKENVATIGQIVCSGVGSVTEVTP